MLSDDVFLKLLSGSHLLGRIDHRSIGEQAQADTERVEMVRKLCPLVYAEMQPGKIKIGFHVQNPRR
jgi:hypothetical protein